MSINVLFLLLVTQEQYAPVALRGVKSFKPLTQYRILVLLRAYVQNSWRHRPAMHRNRACHVISIILAKDNI